jgi:hypothetical protein
MQTSLPSSAALISILPDCLPTRMKSRRFLKDNAPDALAKVVDRLLGCPQFGERWGRHWLDVARFAESTGKETNVGLAACVALPRLRGVGVQRGQTVPAIHS